MIVDIDDPFPHDALPAPGSRRLAERAAAGSHDAWEQIFRSIYPRLRGYAARRAGDDVADDIVSETMTRAIANIAKFQPTDAGMDPWLFGIARRVAADHHRQANRRRTAASSIATPPGAGPAELVETRDEHATLRAEFDQLPAGDRELLELRVVAGLSPDDVAAVLGKRPGAVRTAQSRALGRLRTRLARREGGGP